VEIIEAALRKYEELKRKRELAVRRKAFRQVVAEARAGYLLTGNPLYVWLVWRRCRLKKARVPDWVRAYMDDAANQLCAWIDDPPAGNLTMQVAGAFKFRMGKKGNNPFTQIRNARQSEHWYWKYRSCRDQGMSVRKAISSVAQAVHSTEATVRRRIIHFAEAVIGPGASIADLDLRYKALRQLLKI
jgi:hypothetical protein